MNILTKAITNVLCDDKILKRWSMQKSDCLHLAANAADFLIKCGTKCLFIIGLVLVFLYCKSSLRFLLFRPQQLHEN